MPDPQTHSAIGVASGYFTGVVFGLNPHLLVAGALGALIAEAKAEPPQGTSKARAAILGIANIGSSCLMSSLLTSLLLIKGNEYALLSIPAAAMVGYYGQPLIGLGTKLIDNGFEFVKQRFGGGANG